MASFDQQILISAPPEFIVSAIVANLPADANLRSVKDNALYLLFRGEFGYVYFLREQPDGKTALRLLTDSRVFVEQYFREPSLRAAMVKLTSAIPAMPLPPAQTAAFAKHLNRIKEQAESGNVPPLASPVPAYVPTKEPPPAAPPPPSQPPPNLEPAVAAYMGYMAEPEAQTAPPPSPIPAADPVIDLSQPLKQPKPSRNFSTVEWLIVGLIIVVVLIGVVVILQRAVNGVTNAVMAPATSFAAVSTAIGGGTFPTKSGSPVPTKSAIPLTGAYEDEFIRVPVSGSWKREEVSQLPNCNPSIYQFSPIRFSCYILVSNQNEAEHMIAVVGGGDLPWYMGMDTPLTEVEKSTWDELQKQEKTKLFKKTEVTEITLNGGKDAIRRYYRFPVNDNPQGGFGMQIYFFHKGRIFEITADAVSEEVFKKYRPDLTKFTTGIVFKP